MNETENNIMNMYDVKLMFNEVEKFLKKRLSQNHKALRTFEMTKLVYNNPSVSKIELLKEMTGINYKQLERNFVRYIGLQPKSFINIIKFNYSTKLMYEQPLKPLAQIALDSGYFDQSHFAKSFKNLSGKTPKTTFPNIRSESQ
ncbi:MAG: AraC family transcriptional regulator [Ignavibacteria bacterium]|nr:AraC family transcriptional regulator [Ignavibacteria bacterium]